MATKPSPKSRTARARMTYEFGLIVFTGTVRGRENRPLTVVAYTPAANSASRKSARQDKTESAVALLNRG